jgi:hypothetical protein
MTSAVLTVGRYALHHEIASGGMATVHIGRLLGPVGFARTVAIKRLHAHMARNPEFVAMFLDEARLAARIRHPNVVSTLDVVATEGELFVVMEYVPGDSLSRLLFDAHERGEPVPMAVAASIMVDLLHGLHAAHEASDERGQPLNLVHRDVSPHNVLVGTDGAAHVIDFGIAKATGRAQVTREGQLKGKLCYMAPEQLRGAKVDRRADVFGAAVVFWEVLTGRRLFDGEDEGEIYGKVLRADVTKPSKVVGLDRDKADAIVMRGLARSPDRRYATAREMALEIEQQLPLAPASQVGAWVERHGGDALAERARRIAEVEGTGESRESDAAPPPLKPADQAAMATAPGGRPLMDEGSLVATRQMGRILPHEAAHTDTSLVSSDLERAPRRNRRATALGLGLAALVVVAVGGLAMRDRAPQPGVAPPAPAASSTAAPTAPADLVPSAVPATSVATPDDAVDPSALPLAPAPARPGRPLPFVPPIRRAPGVDCDPPYTVDANGYRKYKRECANR